MARNIFISYRRGVDNGAAGRLFDRLEPVFGREHIFMDVDAIPLGVDFVEHLHGQVAECAVFLSIVGHGWLGDVLRLQDANDFVRIEIEAALQRPRIPIVPVFIDGAAMPGPGEMPESLHPFLRRNGLNLPSESFGSVVGGKLIPELQRALQSASAPVSDAGQAAVETVEDGGGALPGPQAFKPEVYADVMPSVLGGIWDRASNLLGDVQWGWQEKAAEERAKAETARFKPPSIFRDQLAVGGEGPEMVIIPAGEFLMGAPESEEGSYPDERPLHRVRFAQPFALGRNAVTFAEYDRFCEEAGREKPGDERWGRDRRPVINVSYEDAEAYCAWLSDQTGAQYRLPSEAEWEYACRAGTTSPFAFGEAIPIDRANYYEDDTHGSGKTGENRFRTVPVDDLDAANAWGLRHMHGNVMEWCADCPHNDYNGAPSDGSVWRKDGGGDSTLSILRGGSWLNVPGDLRSAYRDEERRALQVSYFGFRLARTLKP